MDICLGVLSIPRSVQTVFHECNLRKRVRLEEQNVQGQLSEHFFALIGNYCVNYPSNIFCNKHSTVLKIGE